MPEVTAEITLLEGRLIYPPEDGLAYFGVNSAHIASKILTMPVDPVKGQEVVLRPSCKVFKLVVDELIIAERNTRPIVRGTLEVSREGLDFFEKDGSWRVRASRTSAKAHEWRKKIDALGEF